MKAKEKKEKLTKEFIDKLEKERVNYDNEGAHIGADGVLCELLSLLGYKGVVEKYEKMSEDFWYA